MTLMFKNDIGKGSSDIYDIIAVTDGASIKSYTSFSTVFADACNANNVRTTMFDMAKG